MNMILYALTTVMALFLSSPALLSAAETAKKERVVKDGMVVSFDYTLKGTDGKVIESSKGKEPLKYIHGQKMMISGLEKEMTGMKVGDEKHVTVKPEDAYGKVDPNAIQEVPKEKIPPNALNVGAVLAARSPDGMIMQVTIREIKEKTVVLDMNHPMAGKTLVFDVKIVDIQPAPQSPASPQGQPAKPAAPAQPAKPAEPNPKK